eukprot:m.110067 g.110067  ORF g.110067 m.110067 type:complete len:143 (+) comp15362_c0_seq5:1859-2287(+)
MPVLVRAIAPERGSVLRVPSPPTSSQELLLGVQTPYNFGQQWLVRPHHLARLMKSFAVRKPHIALGMSFCSTLETHRWLEQELSLEAPCRLENKQDCMDSIRLVWIKQQGVTVISPASKHSLLKGHAFHSTSANIGHFYWCC